ncbi:cytochrome P460 family protein [Shewanella sp. GXUN23E]|uniref:cytochrome P460 family protein n=1 Tax=Shewanella sp. GXUN23E TaxID=3422498 RepID=UPI003D7EFBE4
MKQSTGSHKTRTSIWAGIALSTLTLSTVAHAAGDEALVIPADSNQIAYPAGWQNWSVIASSHRTDNNTLRVILGNDIAIKAARQGHTLPWPDGAVLGKVVWKATALPSWPAAVAPGELVHTEFMFKDSKRFQDSYGWGFGRWLGMAQTPFNEGNQSCIACHTPVKDNDWVFTEPARFPSTGVSH